MLRCLTAALLVGGVAAYGAAAVRPLAAAARPALRPAVARSAAAPTMLDLTPFQLLAEEPAAEEIGPLLIGQLVFAASMVGAGFALEFSDVEVEEEGIAQPEPKEGETDIYRDSLLRFCGYANEVGEAFRPLVPVAVVYFTYVIAITYILADTVDKSKKGADIGGTLAGALGGIDTFCWQMLASVLFPSFIINRVVLLIVSAQEYGNLPELLNASWIATVVGLLIIPAVIVPLDILAHFSMNKSYRRIGKSILN